MLLWLALGCGERACLSLVDVPVNGASAAEGEVVRGVFADVHALVGDAICLSEARRVEREEVEVTYHPGRRELVWTAGFASPPLEGMSGGLRHGLCHALDEQWGVVDRDPVLWEGPVLTELTWAG